MCRYQLKKMETEKEINGKAYVHYKSWHETYADLVDKGYLETITMEKCAEIAHRQHNNVLVAKDGDTVIGFAAYGAYRDSTLPEHGEIYSIYVLAAYQGQLVGYSLMNAAFEKLSGYKRIAVWVLKDNKKAIQFYERYGFHFDGTEAEMILGTPNTELRMIYVRD